MIEPNVIPLEFVPLAETHLDDVLAIEVEAYPQAWTIGMFRTEIKSPLSHFWVMRVDEELVGYGGFWLVLDEAHITSVTVRDTWRGRGIGRRLMLHMLHVASELDACRAVLEVRESNTPARKLYTSLGFQVTGRRRKYYSKTNEDAILMMLEWAPRRSVADLLDED